MNNSAKDEAIKYIVFGVLTTFINIFSYLIFTTMGLAYIESNFIAFILSILFAFITNKLYVFDSKSWKINIVFRESITFLTSRIVTFFIDTISLVILIELFGINDFISKCIVNVIVIILNYILSKFFVFKRKNIK